MKFRISSMSLLLALVFGAPASGSLARPTMIARTPLVHSAVAATRDDTNPRPASTLAVIKEQTQTNVDDPGGTRYAFAEGKLAWFPSYRAPTCQSAVHFLDLASGHRGAVGRCGGGRQLAIADGAILWSTWSGSHSETGSEVYSASRGRTQRLASYDDHFDDLRDPAACGTDLFATGGHAFVSHNGTIFRIAGSQLKPVLSAPGSCFAAASWPYVALEHIEVVEDPSGDIFTSDLRVYRMTDGTLLRTFGPAFRYDVFLSGSLLAMGGRIYDLDSGRQVAVIPRGEALIAIVGRQLVTQQGLRYGPGRVLVRSIGKRPRLLAEIGKDVRVAQTFVRGRALFWIEEEAAHQYDVARYFRLRKPHLEP